MKNQELRYPDFLCIGAQKAGTTWLQRALRQHPDIWLPPFKEIQYFNHVHRRAKTNPESAPASHDARRLGNMLKAMQGTLAGPLSPEQKLARVYCLSIIARAERNDEWYGRIFQQAPDAAVCGEISPDYAVLPDAGVEHIVRLQPNTKFIFIMRDPIDRGWSHLRMGETQGVAQSVPHLQRISGAAFMAYSDYMTTIERYRRHTASQNFLMLFFDDIVNRPRELLRETCLFVGIDDARGRFTAADRAINVGQQKSMDDEIYARFRAVFAPIYERLLELDHPVVKQWYRKHYGDRGRQ